MTYTVWILPANEPEYRLGTYKTATEAHLVGSKAAKKLAQGTYYRVVESK